MAKSLLPLGGFRCVGRAARPLFALQDAMIFQMRQLEAHCRTLWTWRRARGGRMCSYWIISSWQEHGCSPCGPFNACRAGGCNATSKGHEAMVRAV